MKTELIQLPEIAYFSFLNELDILLSRAGIEPSREAIMTNTGSKGNGTQSTTEVQTVIGRVLVYIEEHLTEELSLEKMAEEAQLSKYQLIRLFRKEEGTTPWKFLVARRIDKVKELLKKGLSPGQAAVEAGFYDQSHLNKVFREETGQTPKEYQEKNFKNQN